MLLKVIVGLLITIAFIVMAGLTGILFSVWPSTWPDSELKIGTPQVEQLKALRQAPKFEADPKLFYPGAPNEQVRVVLEVSLNGVIDYLVQGVQQHPKKSFVLSTFKSALARADELDSEEKERLLEYFNEIMRIVGISSSNELLNVWRYGFPYGWVIN